MFNYSMLVRDVIDMWFKAIYFVVFMSDLLIEPVFVIFQILVNTKL